jgi:hypothetical protein
MSNIRFNSPRHTLTPGQTYDALYEVKPSITVYTQLVIAQGRNTESCWISAGFRSPHDAELPIGANILFKGAAFESGVDYRVQYRAVVDRMQRINDKVIHHLTPFQRETLSYSRSDPRFELEMNAKRREGLPFEIINISQQGIRFMLRSYDSLTSAALEHPMTLCLMLDQQVFAIECQIRNVSYNWWNQVHTVGARFIKMSPHHQSIVRQLIGLAVEQKSQKQRQKLLNELVTLPAASEKILFTPKIDIAASKALGAIDPEPTPVASFSSTRANPPKPSMSKASEPTEQDAKIIKMAPPKQGLTMVDPETGSIIRM